MARNMSAKGFLAKTKTKAAASAAAFIATYRDWLLTGEVAKVTSPILLKFDNRELLPTPALNEITNAVFSHMMALESAKADASLIKAETPKEAKNYVATIYNLKDEVQTRINAKGEEEDLVKDFDLPQNAQRWVDRRLTEGSAGLDWYGGIAHTKSDWIERIEREDSFARILKQPKGPSLKPQKRSTPRLSFGVKAKNDTCHFSHG